MGDNSMPESRPSNKEHASQQNFRSQKFSSCLSLDFEEFPPDFQAGEKVAEPQPRNLEPKRPMVMSPTERLTSPATSHTNAIRSVIYGSLCGIEEVMPTAQVVDQPMPPVKQIDHFKSFIHAASMELSVESTKQGAGEMTRPTVAHWKSLAMHDSEML